MIALIGASGRSGSALARALHDAGRPFVPVVRDSIRWSAIGLPVAPRIADLFDARALGTALAGAAQVVSAAHARFTPAILAAAPPEASLVLLGSTRRYSRWRDEHGDGVRAGEAAFLASGRRGVMLHPTMIYGARGEDNVQRLARMLARLPFWPLPGGGRNLVQPIHQDDVTRAVLAALSRPWDAAGVLVIAGPRPVAYRDFVFAVARAAQLRERPIVSIPEVILRVAAPGLSVLPGFPRVTPDEVRRLTEDKAFDIHPMIATLGFETVPLEKGLRQTFAA